MTNLRSTLHRMHDIKDSLPMDAVPGRRRPPGSVQGAAPESQYRRARGARAMGGSKSHRATDLWIREDPQQLVFCAHPPARLGRSHLSVEMISSSLLICLRK